jgi:hypothetical protein
MMYQGREIQVGDSVKPIHEPLTKGMVTNVGDIRVQINWTFPDDSQVSYSYTEKELNQTAFIISPSLSLEQQILDLLG